jgi:hypothetical protein
MKVMTVVLWKNEKSSWNEKVTEWNIDVNEDEDMNDGAGDGDGDESDCVINIYMT